MNKEEAVRKGCCAACNENKNGFKKCEGTCPCHSEEKGALGGKGFYAAPHPVEVGQPVEKCYWHDFQHDGCTCKQSTKTEQPEEWEGLERRLNKFWSNGMSEYTLREWRTFIKSEITQAYERGRKDTTPVVDITEPYNRGRQSALAEVMERREALAEIEHEQWIMWSRNIAATEKISQMRVARWAKLWRPYKDLTKAEKDQDREWADKALTTIIKTLQCNPTHHD